ncbi:MULTISPECIES: tetratricopeptide repeat protein [unclassified Microcoleus]|uniref:tetratricopeptide repeat protein n=1 Tax=unclassified Microcoleus TaxID=2642155 RepID=UPI002FD775FA
MPHSSSTVNASFSSAKPHYSLGKAFAKKGEWEQAISSYRHALDLDSTSAEIYQSLGDALVKNGELDEAVIIYQKAIEIQPDLWEVHHNLGDFWQGQGRLDEAVAAYRLAIAFNPDFSWSHNNLGDVLIKQEMWEEAVSAYRSAIELNPGFHWSHYNLADALVRLEMWEDAIASYRRAIHLKSDLPCVHEKLGEALQNQTRLYSKEAISLYRQAIQQNPDDVELYHKALDIQPDDAELYLGLGNALVRQGEINQAIVFYRMGLQVQPDCAEISLHLAKCLQKNSSLSQAVQTTSINTDIYALWLQENTPKPDELRQMSERVNSFKYKPAISMIMPVYNTPEKLLREAIESVLAQAYPYLELCIADDASAQPHVRNILEEYSAIDPRIKVVYQTQNSHISASSNSALKLATGEFIALLDHDDLLTPDALYEVAVLLNRHPQADMIYSDEDKLNEQGQLTDPFFKPDWCPDSFLSRMYTCHLGVYRRSLVNLVGGFRIGYEGSQDYDLVLRLTEKTDKIFHIPKVLYHWRIHSNSTAGNHHAKSYAERAAKKALKDSLERRGEKVNKIVTPPEFPGVYIVRYSITEYKLVSIIIPTRNLGDVLHRCLKSIFQKTTYANYEVIVIDNGSDELETKAIFADWKVREPNRFKCYEYNIPFNYSSINNYAVTKANGDYILFLNNDTEIITSDWLEAMVEQVQRPTIGAVGALLLYPDHLIQHAGVVMGIGGVAGHSHKNFPASHQGYVSQLVSVNNYSAVTAACLMCRREVFEKVGGFDEQLAVAFNDVDLCLKMLDIGYRNIYLPHVVLYHHESKSRGAENTPTKQQRFLQETEIMKQRWKEIIEHDLCYNPHLTREQEDYSLKIVPVVEILAVSRLQDNSESLWEYSIDLPKPEPQVESSSILIAGWVLGKKSLAVAIELIVNGQFLLQIPVDIPRPDVAAIYPDAPKAEYIGFAKMLGVFEIPPETELLLQAILEDGTRAPLGVVELRYQILC